ncbi:UNVERIFIED_CONTAM: peptidoglycan/xylan/chitin deacetylase (PgdA/CDA1 family) [Brevibacillus sp. OAP136]
MTIQANLSAYKKMRNDMLGLIRGRKPGRLIDLFEDQSKWIKSYGDQVAFDSVTGKLKITSTGNVTAAKNNLINSDLSGVKTLKLRLHIDQPENIDALQIYFANDTAFNNYLLEGIYGRWYFTQGWNEFLIDASKIEVVGSGTFNQPIVTIQMRVRTLTGKSVTVTFDSLISDEREKPQLVIMFDDGLSSQYSEAFRRMQQKGMVGSIAVISNVVGNPGHVTLNQLQDMYKYGWDLVNHTHNHLDLTTLAPATIASELALCTGWLTSNGFTRGCNIVAYPYGAVNGQVIQAMQKYRAGRTTIDGIVACPPVDRYNLKTVEAQKDTSPSEIKSRIDEAISLGGSLILFFHKLIETPSSSTEYSLANFQSIIDYAYTKRDLIEFTTLSAWLDKSGI